METKTFVVFILYTQSSAEKVKQNNLKHGNHDKEFVFYSTMELIRALKKGYIEIKFVVLRLS